jgi:pSer/pThr/pTyr-binding forkhead associated (FHA) protein
MVKDLYSESGVFVNGQRVKDEAFIGAGDVLTLGTMSFAVESMEDAPPVFTHGKFDEDDAILPAAPTFSSVGLPEKEGLILKRRTPQKNETYDPRIFVNQTPEQFIREYESRLATCDV